MIVSNLEECLLRKETETNIVSKQTDKETRHRQHNISFNDKEWKWFDGDLNAYYNSLTTDENHKRDPNQISTYAVHRWLGNPNNTEEQYQLLYNAMERHLSLSLSSSTSFPTRRPLKVFDAGCGLGAGLMWMEQRSPHWNLTGYTISEEQYKYITQTLPSHQFQTKLQSFNDLSEEIDFFDVIYSIEALIHSENMTATLQEWERHMTPDGIILLIDDFLAPNVSKDEVGIQDFSKSWLANSLVSLPELELMVQDMGLRIVEDQDLVKKYKIIETNYKNKKPAIKSFDGRTHQGWMGSKWRQRLTVEGKLKYDLVVLTKKQEVANTRDNLKENNNPSKRNYLAVPTKGKDVKKQRPEILPQLMSGKGDNGGQPMSAFQAGIAATKKKNGTRPWH
jgi:2-polyprenyl-3-methyl-5-hydroxy-6-metoxy-1,4-benzoquinol methylase